MLKALRTALFRATWFSFVLAGAVLLVQVLLWAAPGDPVDLVANGAELRPLLEAEWGLDRPVLERVFRYLGHAARGDLGVSLTVKPGAAVRDLVASAAGRSATLMLPALALGLTLAATLATLSRGRRPLLRGALQLLTVMPVFLMAYLLVLGLNEATWSLVQADRIARPDWFTLPDQDSLLRTALATTVLALGSGALGELHLACEVELVRILDSPFTTAARARGASVVPVVLRNLLPPVLAIAARRVPLLIGGLIAIEKVMLLNGAGSLLWDACLERDYPLAMGLSLVAALVVASANLGSELLRVALDPRLREGLR